MAPEEADRALAGREDVGSVSLSAEQRKLIRHVLTSADRVMLLVGDAGTGKTTATKHLVPLVEAAGRRVVVLAPSADASRGVLRGEGFADAETVASFLLKPALQERAREFAVHAAIGASRWALVRLQIAEGLVLSGIGAVFGVAVAFAAMPAVVRRLPRDTPRMGDIRVDVVVAIAIVGAALAIALVCAILPAIAAGRRRFGTLLREGASSESRAAVVS